MPAQRMLSSKNAQRQTVSNLPTLAARSSEGFIDKIDKLWVAPNQYILANNFQLVKVKISDIKKIIFIEL